MGESRDGCEAVRLNGMMETVCLFLVGVCGGFANAVAGGASLMSLPVLLWVGLPVPAAIATNKLATSGQTILAAFRYHRASHFSLAVFLKVITPFAIGALGGSLLLLELPESLLKWVVGGVLVFALALTLSPRKQESELEEGRGEPNPHLTRIGGMGIGLYGGFFGGGVGLLLVPLLNRFYRLDWLTANGVKAGIAAVMNGIALAVFLLRDWMSDTSSGGSESLLQWSIGLPLLAGMLFGAYGGVQFAVKKGDAWVRAALILATAASLFMLFWKD